MVVEKYGKYLFINKYYLDIVEGWFKCYGVGVIFFVCFILVVCYVIFILVGLVKMLLKLFIFYMVVVIILWLILFIYLGEKFGGNW